MISEGSAIDAGIENAANSMWLAKRQGRIIRRPTSVDAPALPDHSVPVGGRRRERSGRHQLASEWSDKDVRCARRIAFTPANTATLEGVPPDLSVGSLRPNLAGTRVVVAMHFGSWHLSLR